MLFKADEAAVWAGEFGELADGIVVEASVVTRPWGSVVSAVAESETHISEFLIACYPFGDTLSDFANARVRNLSNTSG